MKAVAIFSCDSWISTSSMRLRAVVTTPNTYKRVIKQLILDEEICTEGENAELSPKQRLKQFESEWVRHDCSRKSLSELSSLTQVLTTECDSRVINLNKVE